MFKEYLWGEEYYGKNENKINFVYTVEQINLEKVERVVMIV